MSKLDIQAALDEACVKRGVVAYEDFGILKDRRYLRRDLLGRGSIYHQVRADAVYSFRLRPFRKDGRSYIGIVEDFTRSPYDTQLQQLIAVRKSGGLCVNRNNFLLHDALLFHNVAGFLSSSAASVTGYPFPIGLRYSRVHAA